MRFLDRRSQQAFFMYGNIGVLNVWQRLFGEGHNSSISQPSSAKPPEVPLSAKPRQTPRLHPQCPALHLTFILTHIYFPDFWVFATIIITLKHRSVWEKNSTNDVRGGLPTSRISSFLAKTRNICLIFVYDDVEVIFLESYIPIFTTIIILMVHTPPRFQQKLM
jgi:hypothetical protein